MIKNGEVTFLQHFPMDIFSVDVTLHATSQKHALSHTLSLAQNYHLFTHSDVPRGSVGEMVMLC